MKTMRQKPVPLRCVTWEKRSEARRGETREAKQTGDQKAA